MDSSELRIGTNEDDLNIIVHFVLSYTVTNTATAPTSSDYAEVGNVTQLFLQRHFPQSDTALVEGHHTLQSPIRVEYETTLLRKESSSIMEWGSILAMAFDDGTEYLRLLKKEEVTSEIFLSTTAVDVIVSNRVWVRHNQKLPVTANNDNSTSPQGFGTYVVIIVVLLIKVTVLAVVFRQRRRRRRQEQESQNLHDYVPTTDFCDEPSITDNIYLTNVEYDEYDESITANADVFYLTNDMF